MKLLDYWHFCFTVEELTTIWFSKIASLIYITTVKKKNPVICNNTDEPEGHCDMGNKTCTERQVQHELTSL